MVRMKQEPERACLADVSCVPPSRRCGTSTPFVNLLRGPSVWAGPDKQEAPVSDTANPLAFAAGRRSKREVDAMNLTPPGVPSGTSPAEWLRHVVSIHFDPRHGTPYWMERARALRLDPLRDLRDLEDLAVLGHFDVDDLRKGRVRDFLPAPLAAEPARLQVFETGGTTGVPARLAVRDHWNLMAAWTSWFFDTVAPFPRGLDWLWIGPTGPHAVGRFVALLAAARGGTCFFIDLDPRYVKTLLAAGDHAAFRQYVAHVMRQVTQILDSQEIGVVGTTPALMEQLAPELVRRGCMPQGLMYGGTHLTPDLMQLLRTRFFPEAIQSAGYGNTLMGLAPLAPLALDATEVIYYPLWPIVQLSVVDPQRTDVVVQYGETGRVQVTVLSEEFFIPRLLERDAAERAHPLPALGWDGVANVRPFQGSAESVIEGVY